MANLHAMHRHRIGGAVAACLLVAATARPVAAATTLGYYDVNGNGRTDSWLIDDDGDGRTDRMLVDGNENAWAEAQVFYSAAGLVTWVALDANEDGWIESWLQPAYHANGAMRGKTLWSDVDRNGRWENLYYDSDLDGIYEFVCVDTNYDGVADTWTGNAAPAGRGAVDAIARQTAAIGAVNILHAAGIPVFYP